jgi:pimeloyl-ACP methyl ester carboxylesterase
MSPAPTASRPVTGRPAWHGQHPELLVIDDVGHCPNLEAKHQFNDAVRAFPAAHYPAQPDGL